MDCPHIAIQLLTQTKKFFAALLEVLADVAVGDVQSLLQLLEEMGLGDFVGMQLQTERVKSDFGQTFLNDTESGHLLCYEEYALPLVECVGNHVGDGLRLTCSWRSVKDETLCQTTLDDGFELRGVYGYGCCHIGRPGRKVKVARIHILARFGQDEPSFYQTFHDGALLEFGGVGVDIVPHDELVEGEKSKDTLVKHLPSGVLGNRLTDSAEDERDIHTAFVFGQRVEGGNEQLELLAQEFNESDVENGFLVAHSYNVSTSVAHDIHRQ